MKKIILILFLFFLFAACYYIYKVTEDKTLKITTIGDSIANIKDINKYNNQFIDKNYRLIDLVNTIKYNEEKNIDNKSISIHQVLKNTDILIISIGMNDLYYTILDNTKEIYTSINNIINEYDELLKEISKYDYKEVFVLGYYNIYNKNNDLFTYANYKLKKLANSYNYTYLDLNKYLYNSPKYYINNDDYALNNNGYRQILKLIVEKSPKT